MGGSAPGRLTVSNSRADNMLWVDRAHGPQESSSGPEEGAAEQGRCAAGVVQGREQGPELGVRRSALARRALLTVRA